MKKIILISLLWMFGMIANVNAKPFPILKHYLINGFVVNESIRYQDMLKRFGKPTRSKKIRNDCLETTLNYYYYPTVTFVGEGDELKVFEIYFSNAKNKLLFANLNVDITTTLPTIQALGKSYVGKPENGITQLTLENPVDETVMWNFEFKSGHLYRAAYYSNDC